MKYTRYLESLGFKGVQEVDHPTYDKSMFRCFRFLSVDPRVLHSVLGRSKAHTSDGLFVFLLKKDKAVRLHMKKRTVMLGNGTAAVSQFLRNCK